VLVTVTVLTISCGSDSSTIRDDKHVTAAGAVLGQRYGSAADHAARLHPCGADHAGGQYIVRDVRAQGVAGPRRRCRWQQLLPDGV
jgi:hypothetical protein